jgi:2-keto-4-pentenoate hydratase/2-oxohepta-3-ene-1,7-dioic acid hydratase in catechol pathway
LKRFLVSLIVGAFVMSAAAEAVEAQQGVQRYVRFERAGEVHWGHLAGETIHPMTDAPYSGGRMTGENVPLASVKLKAPVDPINVYMTALNFRSHLGGQEPAPYPGLFIVPPGSIVGHEEDMIKPADTNNYHYEAEMVVVMGRRAENITPEEAKDYIFGVSAGNDGSARDWQSSDRQWTRAKGSRTFNSVGPHLVTGLNYGDLMITGRLEGEVVQGERTSDMLFSVDEMVSYISRYFPLEAGDLIWTGTMGVTRRWSPGQTFEVEVEGVGVLRNTLVQGN